MGFYGKKTAFIIGNGESRKPVNLNFLREQGIIYGCNALYRDFYPDVLVSLDDAMTKEILDANYEGCHIHKDESKLGVFLVDQEGNRITLNKGWSSGATAAFLAASCVEFEDIYLLGFDVYKTRFVDNVYKGTLNYVSASAKPINTVQFREQLGKVMKNAPYKHFIWVTDFGEKVWDYTKNCDLMKVADFKDKFGC